MTPGKRSKAASAASSPPLGDACIACRATDGGYGGPNLKDALKKAGEFNLENVKRSDKAKGFVLPPRRWVVERTFAWQNRSRRLAKDFGYSIASAKA